MKKIMMFVIIMVMIFTGVCGGFEKNEAMACDEEFIEELLDCGFVQDTVNTDLYIYREVETDWEDLGFDITYVEINTVTGYSVMMYYSNMYMIRFDWEEEDHVFGFAEIEFDIEDVNNYTVLNCVSF